MYCKTFGTMNLSVSADVILQDIENKALYKISLHLLFLLQNINNIVLAAPKNKVKEIIDILNSYHSRLQFKFKIKESYRINFLDLII